MRKPVRLVVLGAGGAAVAIVLTACSSGSGSGNSAGNGSAGVPATSAASATTGPGPATIMLSGDHLVNAAGKTLYLWQADTRGKSTCAGACAAAWPPAPAGGAPTAGSGLDATKLGSTMRADGSSQLTYAGHPLYTFYGDSTPGQANGQGKNAFGAKWFEVGATGSAVTASDGASGTSTPGSVGGYGAGY
ncbi:MAG: hypothetical protein JO147_07900 [Actinobacteria bacterium]|nr:hypothetical protein [Actinomycetota bacterium]